MSSGFRCDIYIHMYIGDSWFMHVHVYKHTCRELFTKLSDVLFVAVRLLLDDETCRKLDRSSHETSVSVS